MEKVKERVSRTLDDLPVDVSPGARQVAMVTMFRSAQAEYIEPIVIALRELEALKDWTGGHLVIDKITRTWRDAPFKHWKSFEDFYNQELAETWGKWTDLQETYRLRVGKEISDDQALARITASARVAAAAGNTKAKDKLIQGRHRQIAYDDQETRATENGVSLRTQKKLDYLAAQRPDLLGQVQTKKLSCDAAYRAARNLPKLSGLDRLRSAWKKASPEERQSFLKEINP